MTAAAPARVYVDDRDLAVMTPISRAQWRAWRAAKEGPPWRKVGRRVVYRWSEVEAWLEARTVAND